MAEFFVVVIVVTSDHLCLLLFGLYTGLDKPFLYGSVSPNLWRIETEFLQV